MNTTTSPRVMEDPLLNPPYLTVWAFEHFDLRAWRLWMGKNWTLSVVITILYLTLIFLGQLWMKNRGAFGLRKILVGWNLSLAIFSIFGTLRTGPELIYILGQPNGFHLSVCRR